MTPSSRALVESPLIRLIADGVDHIGNRITAETDAKLAETNARLERVEAQVQIAAKYRRILDHKMHDVAHEAITSGEDRPWEAAEQLDVTQEEYRLLADDFKYGG